MKYSIHIFLFFLILLIIATTNHISRRNTAFNEFFSFNKSTNKAYIVFLYHDWAKMKTNHFFLCFSSPLSLVDSNRSSCTNGQLLSLPRSGIITIRYASSGSLPSHKRITLPALSPTMTKGNLAKWVKKEGDKFTAGNNNF